MQTTTHLEWDAMAALPFVMADWHEGQSHWTYAVASSGFAPIWVGDRLRDMADEADANSYDSDAETMRQAADVLDFIARQVEEHTYLTVTSEGCRNYIPASCHWILAADGPHVRVII